MENGKELEKTFGQLYFMLTREKTLSVSNIEDIEAFINAQKKFVIDNDTKVRPVVKLWFHPLLRIYEIKASKFIPI